MSKKQVMKEIFSEKINQDRIYQKVLLNIKEEGSMKKVRSKKIIYGLSSACAVFILGFGIILGANTFKNTNIQNNYEKVDLGQDKQNGKGSLNINLKINKIGEIGATRLDADIKTISADKLPDEFKFMKNVVIPQEFKLIDMYNIYVRSNQDIKKYDLLRDYVFEYKKDEENDIRVALSAVAEPIRDYYLGDNDKISKIGEIELRISQYKKMYMATFKIKNIYFDVETNGITEKELVELLKSIINENDI